MQNSNDNRATARNRVAAGKEPVGDFPVEISFVGFASFVTKRA